MKKDLLKLVAGFRKFRDRFFQEEGSVFTRLSSQGQRPKTLMIACSDSRVDPAILFSTSPGEVFVVRNVANLVPPFDSSDGYHGVSAAIEFAVVNLKVENILVLGHRQCGGIRSLFIPEEQNHGGYVSKWMNIAEPAKEKVIKNFPDADLDLQCKECEQISISISVKNLKTFPFILAAIKNRGLNIIGVYFDLEKGQLCYLDEVTDSFKDIPYL